METTVYVDVLFFVNFSMDFITLWISSLISSAHRSALRMSLGAAVGALYGVLSVFLNINGALTYIFCGAISIIMCLIAFGTGGGFFSVMKQSSLIWGCGALLGGAMSALLSLGSSSAAPPSHKGGAMSLAAAGAVVFVYISVRLICNVKNRRSVTVNAVWKEHSVSFTALCDSGNLMRDPLSGDPVIPVSDEILRKLCGKRVTDSILDLDAKCLCDLGVSLRLIPHRGDGGSGIIGGFVPDSVTLIFEKKKKTVRCILAPKRCPKNYFAGYAATLPSSLLF